LFRYVNGGWLAETKIPAEYGLFGSFIELRDKSLKDIRSIIEDSAGRDDSSAGSPARKIGDLYAGFMDEKAIEERGLKPIADLLARVDAIRDKPALLRTLAELQRQGVGGLFRLFVDTDAKQSDRSIVYLSQDGISLPDESYYRDPKFKAIREALLAHQERMFALAGRPQPAVAAKETMALETRLARSHWDRVKNRDRTLTYNKKDREALAALTPGFDWAIPFDGMGTKGVREVIVRQPDYFTAMAEALRDVPLGQWKTWLAWNVIPSMRLT